MTGRPPTGPILLKVSLRSRTTRTCAMPTSSATTSTAFRRMKKPPPEHPGHAVWPRSIHRSTPANCAGPRRPTTGWSNRPTTTSGRCSTALEQAGRISTTGSSSLPPTTAICWESTGSGTRSSSTKAARAFRSSFGCPDASQAAGPWTVTSTCATSLPRSAAFVNVSTLRVMRVFRGSEFLKLLPVCQARHRRRRGCRRRILPENRLLHRSAHTP